MVITSAIDVTRILLLLWYFAHAVQKQNHIRMSLFVLVKTKLQKYSHWKRTRYIENSIQFNQNVVAYISVEIKPGTVIIVKRVMSNPLKLDSFIGVSNCFFF